MFSQSKRYYLKSFKILVLLLSTTWLGVLFFGLTPTDLIHTNVLDANGNIIDQEPVLTETDTLELEANNEMWNKKDAAFKARSIAENGISAFNRGDYENAIELYSQALEFGTFDTENTLTLLTNLALAYEAYGDSRNAIKTYELIQARVQEKSSDYHVAKGKVALLGEFIEVKEAIQEFSRALKQNPESFDANNALALIYMGEYGSEFTDYIRALQYNEKTLSIAPKNTNVQINLALSYIELEQYGKAIPILKNVLEVLPQSLPVNYLIMRAYHHSGNVTEAQKHAQKLVQWYDGFTHDKLVAEVLKNQ